jgi:hypothetical protein
MYVTEDVVDDGKDETGGGFVRWSRDLVSDDVVFCTYTWAKTRAKGRRSR